MRIKFLTTRGNALLRLLHLGFNGVDALGVVFQFECNRGIGLLRELMNVGGGFILRHRTRGVIIGVIGGI